MSFILDALKKSEAERQQKGKAEFAGVPTSSGEKGPPRWLWIVAVLLVINLAVLIGLLLRPEAPGPAVAKPAPSARQPLAQPAALPEATSGSAPFEEQVAAARRNAPPAQPETPEPAAVAQPETTRTAQPVTAAASTRAAAARADASMPTFLQLQAEGKLTLPDLHVDIHVYSERPEDRFVFINMTRHREGGRLPEGPVVAEITSDGVVLRHEGVTFLLPRD